MKKIFLAIVTLSLLSGCGGDDNNKTPEGIIIKSVKALSKHKTNDFLATLTGAAREKFANEDQQQALLNSIGKVKNVKFGVTKVVDVTGGSDNQITRAETPVMRDSQILYIVTTLCNRQESTSTHWVCPSTPDPDPGSGGGGWDPGNGGGGGLTPGPSLPHDPGNPGGGDPDRPPRFPHNLTESHDDCYETTSTSVSVRCLISDLR